MKKVEYVTRHAEIVKEYLDCHVKEIHGNLFSKITDEDEMNDVIWKIAVNAVYYSCQVSAMATATLLLETGLIETDDPETLAKLPELGGFLS